MERQAGYGRGRKVDRALMHRNNTRLVLAAIRSAGEMSRAQAAEATGMSIVTVGRIADELMELGILREQEGSALVGRPPKVLTLERERLLCASVFLERDCLHLALAGPCGELYGQECRSIPPGEFVPERVLPWMAEEIEGFLTRHRERKVRPTVGVVVPGIVDISRGMLEFSANFRWRDVAVTAFLEERMPDFRFVLENDIKAVALAEHSFGASAGCRNMVVLSIGDGIGAAVIINGESTGARTTWPVRSVISVSIRRARSANAARLAVFRPISLSGPSWLKPGRSIPG